MDVLRGQQAYPFRYDFHVTSSSNNNEGCSVKIGVKWHAETKPEINKAKKDTIKRNLKQQSFKTCSYLAFQNLQSRLISICKTQLRPCQILMRSMVQSQAAVNALHCSPFYSDRFKYQPSSNGIFQLRYGISKTLPIAFMVILDYICFSHEKIFCNGNWQQFLLL